MTQALPQEKAPLSPSRLQRQSSSTMKIRERAATIRKSFQRPKFWVTGFGWCLAACAGAANTIAFKCWMLYASHVTGSTSNMAFRLEGYQQGEYGSESLKEACSLVLSFLVGAYACGVLIDKNQVHFMGKAFYGLALVLNSALLITAAFIPVAWCQHALCPQPVACKMPCARRTSAQSSAQRTSLGRSRTSARRWAASA